MRRQAGRALRPGRAQGALTEGRDADFVVFDPSANWLMSSREAHTKNTWSAYEGWTFTGHVDLTVRRGAVIWDSHDFGDPDGQWLDARPLRLHTARPATV
ncbi:hypothetical protein ACFQ3Z_34945 [Streptomyces nogalater]